MAASRIGKDQSCRLTDDSLVKDHRPRRISRSRSHVKITGVTINPCSIEETIPPSTGVASGFIPCAPVLADHISGNKPAMTVETVITALAKLNPGASFLGNVEVKQ